jgi:ABC-2 type transport system permease protein
VPIHNQGYRRRGAAPPVARVRIAPIARLAFRQIVMRRVLIVLLAVSLTPMLLEAGGLFVLARFPDLRAMVPPLPELFGRALFLQALFAALLTVWAGTSLVADDFRTGALLVYFSRPLTRRDYVAGKLGVLVALNLLVTAGPLLVLWTLAVALDSQDLVQRGLAFLPVAIAAQASLISLLLAILALAAGAVTRSGTVGGAVLVGGLVLFDAAAAVAPEGARLPLQLLSVRRHLVSLEHVLFSAAPDPSLLHWAAALVCLAIIAGGAGVVLWRRLQAVEVV